MRIILIPNNLANSVQVLKMFSWPIHIFQQKKIQIKKLLQLYSNAAALLAMVNTAWRKENNVLLWTLKKLNEFILCIFKIFLYKLLILADKVWWHHAKAKKWNYLFQTSCSLFQLCKEAVMSWSSGACSHAVHNMQHQGFMLIA